MELRKDNTQIHCRTCLANVTSDHCGAVYLINRSSGLRNSINNCLHREPITEPLNEEDDHRFPQQLCHECFEVLRLASDFRTKVQQAEQVLLRELSAVSPEHGQLSACRICLRQYPQAVQSLTCRVQDAPHLREWLEWSGAQGLIDNDWNAANVVCRFCYSKLRDCYEWHLAAKETDEYLKSRVEQRPIWTEQYNQCCGFTSTVFGDQYQPNDFVSVKEEQFGGYAEYPEYDYMPASNITADSTNEMDNSLLCLDVPYNVKRDFHCKVCGNNFSNSILYENHICPVNTITVLEPTVANGLDEKYATGAEISQYSRNGSKKVCDLCHKRFNKVFLLEAHILQVHQGKKKPFLCKFCTHAYLTHTHLKRHIKNSHKQEWLQAFQDTTSNMNFWI